MAVDFKTVNIKIVASGAGVKKGTDEAKTHIDRFEKLVGTAGSRITDTFSGAFGSLTSGSGFGALGSLLGGFGAGAGLMAGFHVIEKGFDTIAESGRNAIGIARMAEETGITRATLEGLKARHPNQFDSLIAGAEKYNALIGDAAAGSQEARDTLESFGLEWKKLIDMSREDALAKAFDAIASQPGGFAQSDAAKKLMGKGGIQNLPLAIKGGDYLDELAEWAIARGDPHTLKQLDDARKFDERLKRLKANTENFIDDTLSIDTLKSLPKLADWWKNPGWELGKWLTSPNEPEGESEDDTKRRERKDEKKKDAEGNAEAILKSNRDKALKGLERHNTQLERQIGLYGKSAIEVRALAEEERLRGLGVENIAAVMAKWRSAEYGAENAKGLAVIQEQFQTGDEWKASMKFDELRQGFEGGKLTGNAFGRAGLTMFEQLEAKYGLNKTAGPNIAPAIESGSVEAVSALNRSQAAMEGIKTLEERNADLAEAMKKSMDTVDQNIAEFLRLYKKGIPIAAAGVN